MLLEKRPSTAAYHRTDGCLHLSQSRLPAAAAGPLADWIPTTDPRDPAVDFNRRRRNRRSL